MPSLYISRLKRKLATQGKTFRRFLKITEKNPPPGIHKFSIEIQPEVWGSIDCLACGNCCKTMTPTFTEKDITRISLHFNQTPESFKKQWLKKNDGDYVNKSQPCQFLDLSNNLCSIYAVRPADCAGFPHLTKKKWEDYAHVHKQNINYCPATASMIEKMVQRFPVN